MLMYRRLYLYVYRQRNDHYAENYDYSCSYDCICFSGCNQINPTPIPSSGIEGTVTEGPMCPGPVQVGNNNCPNKPYPTTITILNTNNTKVAQIQTDANGYFKLPLEPATYILQPKPGNPLPHAADQTVEVLDGHYTQVTIIYDTGMR